MGKIKIMVYIELNPAGLGGINLLFVDVICQRYKRFVLFQFPGIPD